MLLIPGAHITRPIGEIQRDPFEGIGKPKPLELFGYWSVASTMSTG